MSTATPLAPGDLLTVEDLCDLVPGTTPRTWGNLRCANRGPQFTRIANRVLYRRAAVEQWVADNTTKTN